MNDSFNLTTKQYSKLANCIRALTIDAVEKAKSGHPGMPMGMADVATVLFAKFLKYYPTKPEWYDRDRFVLSAGHGSMLIYALAYLTGYQVSIEDIKNFRQLHAKTAGHPEYGICPAVETTTGPLGQGLANAVGMAVAEKVLAARFGSDLVNHKTYALAGDGCLMEGISEEAISFAGHLKLNNLIVLFDSNNISIDGPTSLSTSTDHRKRFEANGWAVLEADGHNYSEIEQSLTAAQTAEKPVLIIYNTVIGFGSPNKAGSSKAHGAPLGEEEVALAKKKLGWSYPPFEIPEELIGVWKSFGNQHESVYTDWEKRLSTSPKRTDFINAHEHRISSSLTTALKELKESYVSSKDPLASRQSSQKVIEAILPHVPSTLGGSADLTGSNLTMTKGHKPISSGDFSGNYLYYGIREHAMVAIMNGMCLHKGIIPFGGTFLVFTDYARPSIRLSALMEIPTLMIMTHDSIGLGEDGPTHQPVEHLSSLRAIPNLRVYRPCDTVEVAECWELMLMDKKHPAVLSLCRQSLPLLRTEVGEISEHTGRGGYVIWKSPSFEPNKTDIATTVFVATGSEVAIAMDTAKALVENTKQSAAVISVPSMELLKAQSSEYRSDLFPAHARIVVIEAGIRMSWDWLLGPEDLFFGVETFGISAPFRDVYQHFSLSSDIILEKL